MSGYRVEPLTPETWPDFAALVERAGGVFGGCWCVGFHEGGFTGSAEGNRARKECLVREGRAQAALVYDGDRCVGWCQFGPPDELTRIKNRREYLKELAAPPDWRITCFYVDKAYRRKGVATRALQGALEQIAALGGGTVESYPEDRDGSDFVPHFMHNGNVTMFERQGFARTRQIGKTRWVVSRTVAAAIAP